MGFILYVRMKIMKLVSRSLPSRTFALARLIPSRLSLATNIRYSHTSTVVPLTQHRHYTRLPAQPSVMSAPPKRLAAEAAAVAAIVRTVPLGAAGPRILAQPCRSSQNVPELRIRRRKPKPVSTCGRCTAPRLAMRHRSLFPI